MKIISFEGIEGVGKSTQINLLQSYLEKQDFTVDVLREPGSTTSAEHCLLYTSPSPRDTA